MAQSPIAITQGSGTSIDTWQTAGGYKRQAIVIGDPATDAKVLSIGQQTMANSLPVALASDQGAVPVNSANTEVTQSVTSAITIFTQDCNSPTVLRYVSLQLLAPVAWSGVTVVFEGSNDNATWKNVQLLQADQSSTGPQTNTTSTGIFAGPIPYRYFRTRVSAYTSGTVQAIAEFSPTPFSLLGLQTSSTQAGTWTVGSNSATGSAVPANAFYKGGLAKTALPAAATDGNLTGAMVDKFGRQVVLPTTIRDLIGTQTTTISASTSETTIVTAAASTFNDLLLLIISNTSASTTTRIDFRDTTGGSVLFSVFSPAADTRGFNVGGVAIPQTSVNTNWTAQCAVSTTDIRIYAVFAKNK